MQPLVFRIVSLWNNILYWTINAGMLNLSLFNSFYWPIRVRIVKNLYKLDSLVSSSFFPLIFKCLYCKWDLLLNLSIFWKSSRSTRIVRVHQDVHTPFSENRTVMKFVLYGDGYSPEQDQEEKVMIFRGSRMHVGVMQQRWFQDKLLQDYNWIVTSFLSYV